MGRRSEDLVVEGDKEESKGESGSVSGRPSSRIPIADLVFPDVTEEELLRMHPEVAQALRSLREAAQAMVGVEHDSKPSFPASLPEIPDSEVVYTDIDILGSGGFAVVRKGKYQGKAVAVKLLRTTRMASEKAKKQLIDEAKLQHELHEAYDGVSYHPHIVPLLGVTWESGILSLVMPFMSGGDLWSCRWILANPETSWSSRYLWASQIASGLAWMHQRRILHRDLKDNNVLIDELGAAKLSDFGLAVRVLDGEESAPGCMGTLRWVSRDVLVDMKADLSLIHI